MIVSAHQQRVHARLVVDPIAVPEGWWHRAVRHCRRATEKSLVPPPKSAITTSSS